MLPVLLKNFTTHDWDPDRCNEAMAKQVQEQGGQICLGQEVVEFIMQMALSKLSKRWVREVICFSQSVNVSQVCQ